MTDSQDYRLYLTKCFQTIDEKLDTIVEQTTKTNNRVNHLDAKVLELDEGLLKHPINCSLVHTVETLKDDLIEYRFIKKHPNWTIVIVAFFVITFIASVYGALATIVSRSEREEILKTVNSIELSEKIRNAETRGGFAQPDTTEKDIKKIIK